MRHLRPLFCPLAAAACVAAVFAGPTLCPAASAEPSPNIVFFLADDLGVRDTGVGGSSFHLTPHIDALAQRGVRFTQAYAAHPRCVPSRHAILTGRYPARAGNPGRFKGIEQQTVAQTLQQAGYGTYFVGKWHLGGEAGGLPEDHGFDVNVAGGAAGAPASYVHPYNQKQGKNGEKLGADSKEEPIEGLDGGSPDEMLTDRLTQETEKLIRDHVQGTPDRPFFVMLSHYGVHTPLEDTQDAVATFRKRLRKLGAPTGPEFLARDGETKLHQDNPVYAAMVSRLDQSLGDVVALLQELGLAENTVVVFSSDHGGLSNRGNRRQVATSNVPLRAGKGHLYEGGIRVPLMFAGAQVEVGGRTDETITLSTDLHATFAALAGVAAPSDLDAVNLLPRLGSSNAAAQPREAIFWHSPRGRPKSTGDHNASAVRKGDWKLIRFHASELQPGREELFNLAEDPSEEMDLASEHPDRVRSLATLLDEWLSEVDAVEPRVPANQMP